MPQWLNVSGRYTKALPLGEENAETIWNRFGFSYNGWQAFHLAEGGVVLSPLFPEDETELASLSINYAASSLISKSSFAPYELRGTVLVLSSSEWEKLEASIPVIS